MHFQYKVKIISNCFTADTYLFYFTFNTAGIKFPFSIWCADRTVAEDFCSCKAHFLQLLILLCKLIVIFCEMHNRCINADFFAGLSA